MKKKSSNHITYAHDKFVRTVMADPRVAREFFTLHLPDKIRQVTDLENLELQPRSHINEILDILLDINARGFLPFITQRMHDELRWVLDS